MNNFGTRPDPDPTPYGEKYPCFCVHTGQLELLAIPNSNDPTSLKWTIVVSDEVICTNPKMNVNRGAWKMTNWGAIFPSISWKFYKTCGNCKKEPCGGYHQLDNFFLSGDDPVGSAPPAAQKLMDFLGPQQQGSISTSEADALLALTLAALQSKYGDFKDPTKKTCAEVSQWCRE